MNVTDCPVVESTKPCRAAAEWVPIGALRPWAKNPRSRRPVSEVAASIKQLGWGAVIVARRSGEIVAGHTRWEAAKVLGHTEVPVRFVDLDDEQALLLALADNKLGEAAQWDEPMLVELLGPLMLRQEDAAEVAGFDDAAIAALLKSNADAILADADAEPEPEAPARFELVLDCPDEATRRRYIVLAGREGVPCRAVD